MSVQLTKHFTLEELCASATAKARGIQNKPNAQQIISLVYLACYVLEPLREAMHEPIPISSGFRCEQLNRAVGGVSNSQHMRGPGGRPLHRWRHEEGPQVVRLHQDPPALRPAHLGAFIERHLLGTCIIHPSRPRSQPSAGD